MFTVFAFSVLAGCNMATGTTASPPSNATLPAETAQFMGDIAPCAAPKACSLSVHKGQAVVHRSMNVTTRAGRNDAPPIMLASIGADSPLYAEALQLGCHEADCSIAIDATDPSQPVIAIANDFGGHATLGASNDTLTPLSRSPR